jgi:hypothetical protein
MLNETIAIQFNRKSKNAIDEQLKVGIIRRSLSEWSSALQVVQKPDGSIRITVDYKPLNKCIKGDSFPLPNKRLSDSAIFSKIDLKAEYHQIPVDESSIELTEFTCEFGL